MQLIILLKSHHLVAVIWLLMDMKVNVEAKRMLKVNVAKVNVGAKKPKF